jgi:hypothetical protein
LIRPLSPDFAPFFKSYAQQNDGFESKSGSLLFQAALLLNCRTGCRTDRNGSQIAGTIMTKRDIGGCPAPAGWLLVESLNLSDIDCASSPANELPKETENYSCQA